MRKALADMKRESAFEQQLLEAFGKTADHMRNRPEHDPGQAGLRIFPGPDK